MAESAYVRIGFREGVVDVVTPGPGGTEIASVYPSVTEANAAVGQYISDNFIPVQPAQP